MTSSAIDQRDQAPPAKVEVLTEARGDGYPVGRMLVSSPIELDTIIRRIPKGRVVTMSTLRDSLAKNHKADYACPTTTAAFLRIVAEASEEERLTAGARLAPYWRVVRDDGTVLDTLPGGAVAQARLLTEDGVYVLQVGARPRVVNVDMIVWTPPPLGKAVGKKPAPGARKKR